MRYLLVYSSSTGNTKSVAEAIHKIMPESTPIFSVQNAPSPDDYDFIALGFWVHRGKPDPRMWRYMEGIKRKTVAIFGTLAAYPDSDHAAEVIANACEHLEGNEIAGYFLCQGKLPEKRLEERIASGGDKKHPMTAERYARLMEAKKHPDAEDLRKAQESFSEFVAKYKQD